MIFNEADIRLLAQIYARILAWPDPGEDEAKADCGAGCETQSAVCGDEPDISILPEAASGEEPITQTTT